MSDAPHEIPADRSTAADRVPISDTLPPLQPEPDMVQGIGLRRRQSRTIPPPRKWRRAGLTDIVCPECRAKVPGIPDGFWHLQTAHNQGKGVDLEAWGRELRDELDEYIDAARGRRGYVQERAGIGCSMTSVLLAVLLALVAAGVYYWAATGGG